MSKSTVVDILHAVNEFMTEKGWQGRSCGACGRTFFSKPSSKADTSTCGWHECDNGTYPFRDFVKRKKRVAPLEVSTKMVEYFGSIGFGLLAPLNVTNFEGQTD